LVLSWVRLIRVRLVLVNLNPINDTYIEEIIFSRNFIDHFFKGGPEPSNFEDLWLVNVSVKYFSKLCFGTIKIQPELKYLKPFLKSSPLDFSGHRLGNTSLVVFLRFQSFSLVVKWPEVVRVHITNIKMRFSNVKLAQWSETPFLLH